jgi:DNA-binding Xre family transcriptional regulator
MKPLREWRAERLLSTRDLAAKAGVSNKTINEIEHDRGTPTFRTMRRICDALSVAPGDVTEFAKALERRATPTA